MVLAKNYEIRSTFVEFMQKKTAAFFPATDITDGLRPIGCHIFCSLY